MNPPCEYRTLVWPLFVFVTRGNGRVVVRVNGDTQDERPTAHLAVLDVFLVPKRMIDDNADWLAAIGTVKGLFRQ